MSGAESPSRSRRMIAAIVFGVLALATFAVAVALFLICLTGIALLVVGLVSWLHPVDLAAAWARTLGGIGLIGGSTGLAALGWIAVEWLVGPLGGLAHVALRAGHSPTDSPGDLRAEARAEGESILQRTRKF